MVSKTQIKFVKSLHLKKNREESGFFVAEGAKIVIDLLSSGLRFDKIFATQPWIDANNALFNTANNVFVVDEKELKQLSELTTPNEVVAVFLISKDEVAKQKPSSILIALESIRDPGNMGTIIRIADWYGINTIICSEDCVDVYAHKVVQASMGSIGRVNIIEGDLLALLPTYPYPIYAATLGGKINLHQMEATKNCILMIGNEAKGLSDALISISTNTICIPQFGKAESLNASVATAVIIDNLVRLNS
ncbi:MAG: RNA methyltransferase [Bacteroidetes bacterium]|nr:RNA methyltransferase [Bacteroidota bacterium]